MLTVQLTRYQELIRDAVAFLSQYQTEQDAIFRACLIDFFADAYLEAKRARYYKPGVNWRKLPTPKLANIEALELQRAGVEFQTWLSGLAVANVKELAILRAAMASLQNIRSDIA